MDYINGSDILVSLGGDQQAFATSHTTTYSSDTKDRAVKAPDSQGIGASLFKETTVTGLKVQITANGLRHYGTHEGGFVYLLTAWRSGKPVSAECYLRPKNGVTGTARDPYLKANFVITKLTESANADEDGAYDVELNLTGAPTVWAPDKATLAVPPGETDIENE